MSLFKSEPCERCQDWERRYDKLMQRTMRLMGMLTDMKLAGGVTTPERKMPKPKPLTVSEQAIDTRAELAPKHQRTALRAHLSAFRTKELKRGVSEEDLAEDISNWQGGSDD